MISNPVSKKLPFWLTISAGVVTASIAVFQVDPGRVGVSLILIVLAVVALSAFTQIRISRSRIHLTLSEVLVFLWFIIFGSGIATMLAIAEAVVSSLTLRRTGRAHLAYSSILLNGSIAGISTFATATLVRSAFGPLDGIAIAGSGSSFVLMLTLMVASQFLLISFFWTIFGFERSDKGLWKVWHGNCLNGLALYVMGGLAAGLTSRASFPRDTALVLATAAVGVVIYFTYRRYVKELKAMLAKAESAERRRTQQAKDHIVTLQSQIMRLEATEEALTQSETKFRHAAYHDPQTDLPNQSYLMNVLRETLDRREHRKDYYFAVLRLDLSRLKTIRESLGESVADGLIKAVARRLFEMIRENDFIASMSGDEFVILLDDISNIGDAVHFADLTTRKLAAPFNVNGTILFTSINVGIVFCDDGCTSEEEVLRDAQIAMYKAKAIEKPYVVFDKKMHELAVTRLQIETDLRHALENDELRAYYQPIVDLVTMELIGFEALVRWQHPKKGLIGPGEFITVSENAGLILSLTNWMLRRSCRTLARWRSASPDNEGLIMSTNLSGKDFSQNDLVKQVTSILGEFDVPPERVKLEITESAIMENSSASIATLEHFKRMGFKLSIDDFGTGYSSLSYLHRFPIDTLKVDRSFVSTMEIGSENGEIVRTVVTLAKTLGLNIIAEGIESVHQLHQLRVLGCDYGQGFLFSPPVPEDKAELILNDKSRWQNLALIPQKRNFLKRRSTDNVIQLGEV